MSKRSDEAMRQRQERQQLATVIQVDAVTDLYVNARPRRYIDCYLDMCNLAASKHSIAKTTHAQRAQRPLMDSGTLEWLVDHQP